MQQHDVVVQDPHRLGIGLAVQAVDRLDQLLRAEHFGGVQAAVDPDDGLAVLRELPRLIVGEAVGERQLAVHLLELRERLVVLGRRDDGGQLGPAFFRLADLHDRHAVGLLVELLQVLDVLRVVDQAVVVADVVAELLLRRRELRRGRPSAPAAPPRRLSQRGQHAGGTDLPLSRVAATDGGGRPAGCVQVCRARSDIKHVNLVDEGRDRRIVAESWNRGDLRSGSDPC